MRRSGTYVQQNSKIQPHDIKDAEVSILIRSMDSWTTFDSPKYKSGVNKGSKFLFESTQLSHMIFDLFETVQWSAA